MLHLNLIKYLLIKKTNLIETFYLLQKISNEEFRFQQCLHRQRNSMYPLLQRPINHWANPESNITNNFNIDGRTSTLIHQKKFINEVKISFILLI